MKVEIAVVMMVEMELIVEMTILLFSFTGWTVMETFQARNTKKD